MHVLILVEHLQYVVLPADMWFVVEWDGEKTLTALPRKAIIGDSEINVGDGVDVKEGGTKKVYSGVVVKTGKTNTKQFTYAYSTHELYLHSGCKMAMEAFVAAEEDDDSEDEEEHQQVQLGKRGPEKHPENSAADIENKVISYVQQFCTSLKMQGVFAVYRKQRELYLLLN